MTFLVSQVDKGGGIRELYWYGLIVWRLDILWLYAVNAVYFLKNCRVMDLIFEITFISSYCHPLNVYHLESGGINLNLNIDIKCLLLLYILYNG